MEFRTLETKRDRVFLTPSEYCLCLKHAPDVHRDLPIAIRLMGESSFRRSVAVDVAPTNLVESPTDNCSLKWAIVYSKDTKDRDTEGKRRKAWVPQTLWETLQNRARERVGGEDKPFYMRSVSTLRRQIRKLAEFLAEEYDHEGFLELTPHDFRAYFATNLAVYKGLADRIVMKLGGWEDETTFQNKYKGPIPDSKIEQALAKAGVLEQGYDGATSDLDALHREVLTLREEIAQDRSTVDNAAQYDDLTTYA